ncbi:hypothetical protein RF11_07489 [Thelohanellus kitauei]|uniref:Uncharacterized protein n=1 Tax=Thelohanellus kitauei TaxID=669202 RepID=A0A0C2JQ22_THEKT|nr:hypothetical protein RF11_07489 [Thelohanellus kitauei]
MKIENIEGDGVKEYINPQLIFPYIIEGNTLFANERIMVMETSDHKYRDFPYFIFYNGDNIGKHFPFSSIQFLNKGGIILGLDKTSKIIMYTFDEGQTYYNLSFSDEYTFIYGVTSMGHYENEAFIFFGMNQNKSRMIFTHVDFTSLFSRPTL